MQVYVRINISVFAYKLLIYAPKDIRVCLISTCELAFPLLTRSCFKEETDRTKILQLHELQEDLFVASRPCQGTVTCVYVFVLGKYKRVIIFERNSSI